MPSVPPIKAKKPGIGKGIEPKKDRITKGMQARERIITVAETLFNQRGVDGASMRDIAASAKMQPASMYYYFASKDELLWAVWEKGGIELLKRVNDAVELKTAPWQRLETACIAHVTGLLDWRRANQVLFILPPWHYPDSIKARVIALRHEYEKIFISLIDDLPLRDGVDRLRDCLQGAVIAYQSGKPSYNVCCRAGNVAGAAGNDKRIDPDGAFETSGGNA